MCIKLSSTCSGTGTELHGGAVWETNRRADLSLLDFILCEPLMDFEQRWDTLWHINLIVGKAVSKITHVWMDKMALDPEIFDSVLCHHYNTTLSWANYTNALFSSPFGLQSYGFMCLSDWAEMT